MPILGYILRLFISVRWPTSIFELLIDCTKLKSFTVVVLFEKSKNVTSMHNKILIIHGMYTVDICNLIHNSTSKEGFISIFQRFNIQETILVSVTNSRYRFNLYENPPNDILYSSVKSPEPYFHSFVTILCALTVILCQVEHTLGIFFT